MAENEKLNKSCPSRRNTQNRPTPGVQKAMQTFGVRDLREILDMKRQEQVESQGEKRPDPKLVKLPPPDPSYNYLKDPTRDMPISPQKKSNNDKQYERPVARDRETHFQQHRYKDARSVNRGRDEVFQQVKGYNSKKEKEETSLHQEKGYNNRKERDDKVYNSKIIRHQENKESNSYLQEKGVLNNQKSQPSEGVQKKELRFSDDLVSDKQFASDIRRSVRGRNAKRGNATHAANKEEKIENPINIRIELSTETGIRNCTLDESTKIADIKHVPDNPNPRHFRGGFRGGRGSFRGRGRGRGSYRSKGAYRGRGAESKIDMVSHNQIFNMEKLKKNLPNEKEKSFVQSVENRNIESDNGTTLATNIKEYEHEDTHVDLEGNLGHYEEYDQENEEYNDANDNYDDEFPIEYYSEYQSNSGEQGRNIDNGSYENLPESETYDDGGSDVIDPNLKGTITITSSKFQDGEVKRSVEVMPQEEVAEKE